MKQKLLFSLLLSSLALISCDNNTEPAEPGSYPTHAAFVTTYTVEAQEATEGDEEQDETKYYLQTDAGVKLFLADNAMLVDFDFDDKERIIAYYAVIEDYSADGSEELEGAVLDCDYGIRLFGVREIFSTQSVVVETEEQSDEIADHALAYVYDNFNYSYGYLNLIAGLKADKLANVKFYLVENLSKDPDTTKNGYLNLELRYDRATDESMGSTYEEYVSMSLADFKDQLEEKKGVILRVLTSKSGTINLQFDFEDEQEVGRSVTMLNSAKSASRAL